MWLQAAFEGVGSMPMARIRNFRAEQQQAVDADMLRRGARGGGSGDPGVSPAVANVPAAANGSHPPAAAAQDSSGRAAPTVSAEGKPGKGDPTCRLCFDVSNNLILSRLLVMSCYVCWSVSLLSGAAKGWRLTRCLVRAWQGCGALRSG